MSTGKENKVVNPDSESLINNNEKANPDKARSFDKHDAQESNVDPLKKQFERSNLQSDQEKRAGSGGAAMDPGRRDDRQNNGNDNK